MITHLVLFKVHGNRGEQRHEADCAKLLMRLESLREAVPSLLSLSVGRDFSASGASWDVGLVTTFANEAGLEAYRVHPCHQEVVKFVQMVTTDRAVVDFSDD